MSRYRLPREIEGVPRLRCARCRLRPVVEFGSDDDKQPMRRARLCAGCVAKGGNDAAA